MIVKIDEQVPKIDKQNYLDLKSYLRPFTISLLSIVITSVICLFLRPFLEAINIPMIFIIPIVVQWFDCWTKGRYHSIFNGSCIL